jgi:MFS family permease
LRAILSRPALVASQGSGVVLLVAIQHFHAGPNVKAALAGASFLGLFLAPLAVTIVAQRGSPLNRALALMLSAAALALAASGTSGSLWLFVAGVLVGVPLIQATVPLVTAMWEQNVPARIRGRWFGVIASASTAAGALSGLAIARWMGADAGRYRPVMIALAGGVALAAVAALRIPGAPPARGGRNPLARLSLLWRHPRFGTISIAWMLLGFGNLITVPLRTELLASGDYGPVYAAEMVLYLTVVLPQVAALLSVLVWGPLFDRLDFLWLRMILNGLFVVSILTFFTASLPMQVLGAVLFGLAQGGGLVAWNLWVTKYAPPHRTADYMAVHTFLTGVRGIGAPFIAYALLDGWPLSWVIRLGVLLILLASLMLAALLRRGADRGQSSVTEEGAAA